MKTAVEQPSAPAFAAAATAAGMPPFKEQETVADRLARTAEKGMVGFVEAPTATGKTLALCHSALSLALSDGAPCVVAVPTVAVGHQTMVTLDRLREANEAFRWLRTRMVVGRQDFVSPDGLADLVATLPADAAASVSTWISAGAPGRTPSHASWTADGLEHRLDLDGIAGVDLSGRPALSLGPSDAGSDAQRSYERQFSADADVLVVTHAMLGRDLLSRFVATSKERKRLGMKPDPSLSPAERWLDANRQRLEIETGGEGRLPDHRRLIVDEAHLLRESIESSMSTGVALCGLLRQVRALSRSSAGLVPSASLRQVKAVRDDLVAIATERTSSVRLSWSVDDPLQRHVRRLHDALAAIRTSKTTADLEHDAIGVERARHALAESLRARDAVSTVFEWSPVRSFPTITVGRRNLRSELDFLWSRLASAALVSATLYTENVSGPSLGYMSNRLGVPPARVLPFPPIVAPWIRRPVTAYVPSAASASLLSSLEEEQRLDDLAARISAIAAASEKGMLVLSTSRADSHALSTRLASTIGAGRIIDGTTDRLVRLKTRHVAMARAGIRPVWLAQGPAWTGLDLPDDAIDALAIARLPFPRPDAERNDGPAHYGADKIARMAMTLKQGVGRLVRTRDASPKTLHFLDGRIRTVRSAGIALALARSFDPKEFE